MKIKINNPITFFSNESPVHILDDKKNLFYYHPNDEHEINFNLPVGIYYTKNKLFERVFTPYERFKKPFGYISPNEFKPIVKTNIHKATILIPEREIILDPSIAYHKFKPCTDFTICHEIFHTVIGGTISNSKGEIIFDAEKPCDDFAKNYMLSFGWNPIQIDYAVKLILNSDSRKNCIHNSTVQMNFRK